MTLAALLAWPALAADYTQVAGSTLAFASQYDGEAFKGRFPRFQTRLRFDPSRLDQARLEVDITLTAVDTGNAERDDTLRGADFFDVARFAQARYTADKFRRLNNGQYAADGTLELRGVKKPVTLTFAWTPGTTPILTGKASVKRLAFGVGGGDWADTGSIPDAVSIDTRVLLQPAP